MRRSSLITVLIVCVGLYSPTHAGETQKALTNTELLEMLRARVPEGTIPLVIESAAWQRNAQLDASTGALVELRKQGATQPILNAVLAAEATQRARLAREKVLAARPPGLPTRHGVYYRGASGWVSLPSSSLWSQFTINWIGFRGDRYRMDLLGPEARLQLVDHQPAFYISDFEPDGQWQLFALSKKRSRRELRVISRQAFPLDLQVSADAFREMEITAVPGSVFTLRPRSELDPGEYALCQVPRGGRSLLRCYEFGVVLNKPSGHPGARTPT